MGASGGNRYNFIIVFFVALGSFTYGYNSAIMGSAIGLPSFFEYFKLSLTGPNAAYGNKIIGTTNGLYAGGGIIGCLTVPWMLDALGRKRSVQIICCVCVISAILQGASVHIAMFLVARFINGIGVGMIDVTVPIYQSEISPASQRGRMVGSHGFLLCCGYGLAGFTGYGCYFIKNPAIQWRLCLSLQVVAPLLLLLGSPLIPESPRWLIANRREQDALVILRKLHFQPSDPEETLAREEFYQVRKQIELERNDDIKTDWISLFKKKSYRKRLLFGAMTQVLAQSTGVLVVNNYQILLYNSLGLYGSVPLLLYAFYDSWAAFLNFINSLLLDRIGRIKIMSCGLIGCALSLSCFAAMVARFAGTDNKVGNGFGVFFLFLFVTFYGGSMDASSYVYCSEIFPTRIRARGVGFSVAGLFTMTLIYTEVAPTAFAEVGWRFYLLFIILPLVGVGFMWTFFPETKGRPLEEIAGLFGDEVAVDISHLDEGQRRALDKSLMVDGTPENEKIGHGEKAVHAEERETNMA